MSKNKSDRKKETILVYGTALPAIFESIDTALGVSIGVISGVMIALVFGKKIVQLFGNPDKTESVEEIE